MIHHDPVTKPYDVNFYNEEVDQLFDEGRAVVLFLAYDPNEIWIDETGTRFDYNAVGPWIRAIDGQWRVFNALRDRIVFEFGDEMYAKLFKIAFGITSTKDQWKTVGGIVKL